MYLSIQNGCVELVVTNDVGGMQVSGSEELRSKFCFYFLLSVFSGSIWILRVFLYVTGVEIRTIIVIHFKCVLFPPKFPGKLTQRTLIC
jgi:hypothetical protein